jgi:hypothetical protein
LKLHTSLLENKLSLHAIRIFSRKDLPSYLIVFISAISLKGVAELIAYPYPIGYDVINYYIPMLSNFESEWNTILREYPFYAYVLHHIQSLTGLSVQTTVSIFAILIFGLFAVSILSLGKAIIRNSNLYAVLFSLFVIVQIPILRTTWDLHRDMFSLTMMFFAISILIQCRIIQPNRFPSLHVACCLVFAVLSVISDRMVGAWLIVVYCICTILYRERIVAISFIVALVTYTAVLAVTGDGYSIISSAVRSVSNGSSGTQIIGEQGPSGDSYTIPNLFAYFVAMNLLLVPFGIVGYLQQKERLLKIGLIVALVSSMTWLVFPYAKELVADRWILLFGISLSIFAGFGFVKIVQVISARLRNNYIHILVSVIIFLTFAQFGIKYAVLPYEAQFSVIGLFDKNIQEFAPKSMQFNSVRVEQSPKILDVIHWINENTSNEATIVASSDWRGWFILELDGNRRFVDYESIDRLLVNSIHEPNHQLYLIDTILSEVPIRHRTNSVFEGVEVYSNSPFSVYKLLEYPKNVTLNSLGSRIVVGNPSQPR